MKRQIDKLIPLESRPERVGPRITAIRETLEMEKVAFARSLEFDPSSQTKVEKGSMGLDIRVAIRIAEIYGFGLDFIYRGDLSDCPLSLRQRLMENLARNSTSL